MKKQFLLFSIWLFFSYLLNAQNNLRIGINLGGNFSFTSNEYISPTPKLGYQIGLNFEYPLNNKDLSLKSNLNYIIKSFNDVVDITDEYGFTQEPIKSNFDYQFISLPLLVKYNFTKSKRMFVNTGISFEYLFNTKSSFNGFQSNFSMSQLNLEFSLGLGTTIPIKKISLDIELRYNPYVTNIIKSTDALFPIKTNTIALFTTWNFDLKK